MNFDLDQAITEWRQRLSASIAPDDLDELEGHLRDDVEQASSRLNAQQAFELAVNRLGGPEIIGPEFRKIENHTFDTMQKIFFTLAGIPQATLATPMNTGDAIQSGLEPRWATYTRALLLALPALVIWGFSLEFILPKIKHMSAIAGFTGFTFVSALVQLSYYWFLTIAGVAGVLLFLEWRSARWPRYRRAAVSFGAYALNAIILVAVTLLVISAIVTAPALAQR